MNDINLRAVWSFAKVGVYDVFFAIEVIGFMSDDGFNGGSKGV